MRKNAMRRTPHLLLSAGFLSACLFGPHLFAAEALAPGYLGDDPSVDEVGAPAEELGSADQLAALQTDFQAGLQRFYEEYEKAPEPKPQTLFEDFYPKKEVYVPKALQIAASDPGSETALETLLWAMNTFTEADVLDQVLPTLGRDFGDSERMKEVCEALIYSDSVGAEAFLLTTLSDNPYRNVRGFACYALARQASGRVETANAIARDEDLRERVAESRGEAYVTELEDVAYLETVAVRRYQQVVDEFQGVAGSRGKDLAERAGRDLFELQNLVVGKAAPEIEGEDVDGVPFKLSDYRGKIVFLDFWGDW